MVPAVQKALLFQLIPEHGFPKAQCLIASNRPSFTFMPTRTSWRCVNRQRHS
jgi:hypothetical protein